MLEKQFYTSINSKFINDLCKTIDQDVLESKSRRNKVLSEYKLEELLNPIKKHQITKEIELAEVEDNLNNSCEDMEYENQRDINENERELSDEEEEKREEKEEEDEWRDCDEKLVLE